MAYKKVEQERCKGYKWADGTSKNNPDIQKAAVTALCMCVFKVLSILPVWVRFQKWKP